MFLWPRVKKFFIIIIIVIIIIIIIIIIITVIVNIMIFLKFKISSSDWNIINIVIFLQTGHCEKKKTKKQKKQKKHLHGTNLKIPLQH